MSIFIKNENCSSETIIFISFHDIKVNQVLIYKPYKLVIIYLKNLLIC